MFETYLFKYLDRGNIEFETSAKNYAEGGGVRGAEEKGRQEEGERKRRENDHTTDIKLHL